MDNNLKSNDYVMVKNTTLDGKVIDEGKARIRKRLRDNHFLVEFYDQDPGRLYDRFVSDDDKIDKP